MQRPDWTIIDKCSANVEWSNNTKEVAYIHTQLHTGQPRSVKQSRNTSFTPVYTSIHGCWRAKQHSQGKQCA